MRRWIFVCSVCLLWPCQFLLAQPKVIPPPPGFQKLIGPTKFDPEKLREAIAIPINRVQVGVAAGQSGKPEPLLPVAVLEKRLVGDERDAETLLKLGRALTEAKSDRAQAVLEKSAAAFRARIAKEPKKAQHHLDLIDALSELNRRDEIFACARKCVELDPKNSQGWTALEMCYWHEFYRLVYGDGKISMQFHSEKPPAKIGRELKDAEVERARTLLKYIRTCEDERKRHARDNLDNLMASVLMGWHWELFDSYFRTGKWDVDESPTSKAFFSRRMVHAYIERGRETQNPGDYGAAAMLQFMAFLRESDDPDWSFEKATPVQKKTLAAIIEPIEELARHKDVNIGAKANCVLAMLSTMEQDVDKLRRCAAKALELAPREKAIVDLVNFTQSEMPVEKREQFWREHLRKHPSARGWEYLAVMTFRDGRLKEAEQYLRQAEQVDSKVRSVQLVKAALLLKIDKARHAEAGKILDALEQRLDEPEDKISFIVVQEFPSFQESCRYLRAIHKALSGAWEKGRDELMELRENDILATEIGAALEAFPPRPILLPPLPLELKGERNK